MSKQTGSTTKIWLILSALVLVVLAIVIIIVVYFYLAKSITPVASIDKSNQQLAINGLDKLTVKPAADADSYDRKEFGSSWASWRSCNTRQKILGRDVKEAKIDSDGCTVISGKLPDPYTGRTIELVNKSAVSRKVQIDHVVALANAWQTGASQWDDTKREQLANDDLELIAVSSNANQEKSDADAAGWLPSNRGFRCAYVARQIAVKLKYALWVTSAEKTAMTRVLNSCPNQLLPITQ